MTNPSSVPERCQNPRCPRPRRPWWQWRQPKGIWLNKRWYCGLECFEQAAASLFVRMDLKGGKSRQGRYRMPLGLLMLSKGLITGEHLQEALKAQKESQRGRLGEWLRQLGIVTEEQLTTALGMQWGYPVFHLAQSPGFAECAAMTPLPILEAACMAPVHYLPTSRTLYVAFSDGIDFAALRGLEQMLDLSTQPCVIGETEMAEALEEIRRLPRPSETLLDCPCEPQKLAATTRDWAQSNAADRVRVAACSDYLWVRIENLSLSGHLLIRLAETLQPVTL